MLLKSKISDEISIEHVDFDGPERFVVSGNGLSYTVFPHGKGVTGGDIDAVTACPMPTEASDGTTVRVSMIYETTHRSGHGATKGAWATRLQAMGADGAFLDYYALETYGTSDPIGVHNDSTPSFHGVFEDVTDDFVRSATPDQRQARLDMGAVYQRLCVDADPKKFWGQYGLPGIVFSGAFAPAIQTLPRRELTGLLVEAGFANLEEFARTCFRPHEQSRSAAEALLEGVSVSLPAPDAESLDYHRLDPDDAVQDEAYMDMVGEAVACLARLAPPDLPLSQTRPAEIGLAMGM